MAVRQELSDEDFRALYASGTRDFTRYRPELVDIGTGQWHGVNFSRWKTGEVCFDSADLSYAKFREVDLNQIGFTKTILKSADFTGAHLSECEFDYADLRNVDFSGAKLEYVNFTKACMDGAVLDDVEYNCVVMPDGSKRTD